MTRLDPPRHPRRTLRAATRARGRRDHGTRAGCAARRRRAGPAVPHGLPGHAPRAAHDARPVLERGGDRRAASRTWRGRVGRRRPGGDPHVRRGCGSYAAVVERIDAGHGRTATVAVSDTLWASHLLGIQGAIAADPRFDGPTCGSRRRAARAADGQGCRRDRAPAPRGAGGRPGRRADRGGPPDRSDRADVSREVRDRLLAEGHETAPVRDRRLGAELRLPHHEASERVIQAGEPIVLDIGGSLSGYGSDITRTLWVTGGDPAKGPDERVPPPVRRPVRRPGSGHAGRPARRRLRGGRCGGAPADRGRRLRRGVLPPDRARHRPRGPRGSVHDRRQRASRSSPGWPSRSSPGSTSSGEYGARIEDIVVCGPDGPIALNEAPRELYVVDG